LGGSSSWARTGLKDRKREAPRRILEITLFFLKFAKSRDLFISRKLNLNMAQLWDKEQGKGIDEL
jgi:hypothetical protein